MSVLESGTSWMDEKEITLRLQKVGTVWTHNFTMLWLRLRQFLFFYLWDEKFKNYFLSIFLLWKLIWHKFDYVHFQSKIIVGKCSRHLRKFGTIDSDRFIVTNIFQAVTELLWLTGWGWKNGRKLTNNREGGGYP